MFIIALAPSTYLNKKTKTVSKRDGTFILFIATIIKMK